MSLLKNEQLLSEAPMTRSVCCTAALLIRWSMRWRTTITATPGIEADADPVSMANVRYPSAMAINFGIDADAVSTLKST